MLTIHILYITYDQLSYRKLVIHSRQRWYPIMHHTLICASRFTHLFSVSQDLSSLSLRQALEHCSDLSNLILLTPTQCKQLLSQPGGIHGEDCQPGLSYG